MRVGICCMGWNKSEYTARWLASVQRNSAGHVVDLYLMDNGSTDGDATGRLMRSVEPRRFWRNETNESIYRGWNTMVRAARDDGADVIVIASNDVMVGPRWLDPVEREVVCGDNRYFLPNGEFERTEDLDVFSARVDAALPGLAGGRSPGRAGWTIVLPARAVDIFYPIPEELMLWYGDDWIHDELAAAGYRCEVLRDCCALHYGSVTLFSHPSYVATIARDKSAYERITGRKMG